MISPQCGYPRIRWLGIQEYLSLPPRGDPRQYMQELNLRPVLRLSTIFIPGIPV
jgi:hypothetical protein